MRNETIEAVDADGCGLRLEFRWLGDRYGHVISRIGPGLETKPLLETVEGSARDAWPSSPPLQTLSIEKLPDGRTAALLVGMAGGGHWSASIEAGEKELVFDIACRRGNQSGWLGCRYRWLAVATGTLLIAGENSGINQAGEAAQIAPQTVDGKTVRWRYAVALE